MKKKLIVIGIIIIQLVLLCGCISDNSTPRDIDLDSLMREARFFNHNLGESITVGDIKYTFVSARWKEGWGAGYQVEIDVENIGIRKATASVSILKYITQIGYEYTPHSWDSSNSKDVNPGRTDSIVLTSSAVDKDFLPVVEIHLRVGGRAGILHI